MSRKNTPRLITIEGCEAAGKTTAVKAIRSILDKHSIPYIVSREPGGTKLGEEIRNILLKSDKMDSLTELLLMFAARQEHIAEVITPALSANKWVILDRYIDSSYAYQGAGRGIDANIIMQLDNIVSKSFQPALTFLLDVAPEISAKRLEGRQLDRIEQEEQDFFVKVRNGFIDRAAQHKDRFCVVDASQSIEQVTQLICDRVELFINAE